MNTLINIREKYYRFGRFIAVFVISPILIISGQKYNDNKLILIGIIIFLWDILMIRILKNINLQEQIKMQ